MDEILKYFPDLTQAQINQFSMLGNLYKEWNEKINVVSRRDIDNLYTNHILHSLAIAKFMTPESGTRIMDLGCGGGFPGIPLAIIWTQCRLHLIDRIGKKINVARAVAAAIGLTNVTLQHGDSSEYRSKVDYVVSRAVMSLPELVKACRGHIAPGSVASKYPNGLICLKGGDLDDEIAAVKQPTMDIPLSDWFSESYFSTKRLIYVNFNNKK